MTCSYLSYVVSNAEERMCYGTISNANVYKRVERHNVDDRRLEVILAAVEEGSLGKAAARCHCTQSAVTQLVNSIESELGCKVLARSHAGVRLTEMGSALLPAMRNAREALDQLKSEAERLSRRGDHVRLGAYPSIVQSWLPGAIAAFAHAEPLATFDIRIGSSDLTDLLRDGGVDLLLCDDWLFEDAFANAYRIDYRVKTSETPAGGARWTPLVDDPFRAAVPVSLGFEPGKPVKRSELFEHPYIFDTKYVFARYMTSEVSSIAKVSSDDSASILSMVASGMGVTVLPELCLRYIPDGVAIHDIDPPGKRTLGAVLPADATKMASRFVEFLSRRFG